MWLPFCIWWSWTLTPGLWRAFSNNPSAPQRLWRAFFNNPSAPQGSWRTFTQKPTGPLICDNCLYCDITGNPNCDNCIHCDITGNPFALSDFFLPSNCEVTSEMFTMGIVTGVKKCSRSTWKTIFVTPWKNAHDRQVVLALIGGFCGRIWHLKATFIWIFRGTQILLMSQGSQKSRLLKNHARLAPLSHNDVIEPGGSGRPKKWQNAWNFRSKHRRCCKCGLFFVN